MSDDAGRDSLDVLLDPSIDDGVFRAMTDRERRFVLYFLLERDRVSFDELVDVVTGWSTIGARGMATPDDRDLVRIRLYHRHLGSLEEAGLVDRVDDHVRLASLSDPVVDLVRWAYRAEDVGGAAARN